MLDTHPWPNQRDRCRSWRQSGIGEAFAAGSVLTPGSLCAFAMTTPSTAARRHRPLRFIAAKSRKASVANVKSMLWSGECAILGYAGRAASSLDGCGSNDIIRRQRPPDPLQLELADRLDLHGILDRH